MDLIFRAIFQPKRIKSRSHIDSLLCLLVIILVFAVSFWPFFVRSFMWWKVLLAGGFLFPLYVYGIAGVYLLIARVDNTVEFVSSFPGVMVPYIFFPPLYIATGSFWLLLPLALWSGILEVFLLKSRSLYKTLFGVIAFKALRIALLFLVVAR
ncbi:MAG: hypothetical protein PWP37_934 [Thermotogota bacterium]|nr:hypothetical protein [Thermotogota bacterium]HCZ06470.1 hypothetical protein [Thermotogota bacterium]